MTNCMPKLEPNPIDDRGCYVGVLPASEVEAVRRWAPRAEAGDRLLTAFCDRTKDRSRLNDLQRMTR